MPDSDEVLNLVSEGLGPPQIANALNLPLSRVYGEILAAVHSRCLLRSQVQSTLNQDWLRDVSLFARHPSKRSLEWIQQALKDLFDCDSDVDEVRFYIGFVGEFRDGETYELLSELERTLHRQIRHVLEEEFGKEEIGWWRAGVPKDVREDCARARELDDEFSGSEPYAYTTLTNLKCILEKKWALFMNRLPQAVVARKDEFIKNLETLNGVRNRVMHPVRGEPPDEDDFRFVRQMAEALHTSKWRQKKRKG